MVKLIIVFISIICISCGTVTSQSEKDSDIHQLLIDKLAVAYPLPNPVDHPTLSKKDWDSINKIPTTIIINPNLLSLKINKDFSDNLEYNNLIHSLNNSMKDQNKYIDRSIHSKEGHKIIYGESLKVLNEKYSQLISFSPIAYNHNNSLAVIIVAYSNAKLSGFTNLYFLKKRSNSWKIKDIINLSKS